MKSNKGITLTSLVVYITGLVIIIGLMGTFTGYFYNNLNESTMAQNAEEEYSKFLAYITKDTNSENLVFIQSGGADGEDCVILKFINGEEHQYIYQNSKIYYLNTDSSNEKKITLCRNITTSTTSAFSYSEDTNTLEINFNINNENFTNSLTVNL